MILHVYIYMYQVNRTGAYWTPLKLKTIGRPLEI